MYREAIYHSDLSISKTFHIFLPSPLHTHILLNALLQRKLCNHLRFFFIPRWLDEQTEIKMEGERTSKRVKSGTTWERDIMIETKK